MAARSARAAVADAGDWVSPQHVAHQRGTPRDRPPQGLKKIGYSEGQNVALEFLRHRRWPDLLRELAQTALGVNDRIEYFQARIRIGILRLRH